MKLFIDTAIIEEIEQASSYGIISGVTTNPSLLAKSGKSMNEVITKIISLVDGPISAEVNEDTEENMYAQAHQIVEMTNKSPNITIKLPMTIDGIKVCSRLSKKGIKTNVTLVFSLSQAVLAMEAGATFISPFMGRLDDYHRSDDAGFNLIAQIAAVRDQYNYKSQIIAASIRGIKHVEQAALAGADIATIPFKVIKQMYEHPLTENGLKIFKEAGNK